MLAVISTRQSSSGTCMASLACQFRFCFCTNPDILSEKRTKPGRAGERGAGGWAIRAGAVLRSMFLRRK